MAFLLATFGVGQGANWGEIIRGVIGDLRVDVDEWQQPEALVRLGVARAEWELATTSTNGTHVVAVVGRVDGSSDAGTAILAGYRANHIGGLRSLHGPFAYVLWDTTTREMIAGCDALGLRAPAFAWTGRTFVLCSSALALTGHPTVGFEWDRPYLAHALSGLCCRTSSATAFRGIHRMTAGEILRVSTRGLERLRADPLTFRMPLETDRRRALINLDGAVGQAVVDGPTEPSCVALSGGVDSCVIATTMMKLHPELHAFSLVAPEGTPGRDPALQALLAALPTLRHQPVKLTGDEESPETGPLADDPVGASPVLQPGRLALLNAARSAGFRCIFDGEGGDELFSIVWRQGDWIRELAFVPILKALAHRGSRGRLIRDFAASGLGPLSSFAFQRARRGLQERRPWLRPAFWQSAGFEAAWREVISQASLPSVRRRMPEVLGGHARYWRAQELARQAVGVEGYSPFMTRRVVEVVGSARASIAIDAGPNKAWLRRLAERRVPSAVAWRPKAEPLSEWLNQRWVSKDSNVARTIAQIKRSNVLAESIDTGLLVAAADQASVIRRPNQLASSIVGLATVVAWVSAVEQLRGLS